MATITISAPSSAQTGTTFTISGYVRDNFGNPMVGVNVWLYEDGNSIGSDSTNSSGQYSKSHSISTAGIHELAANYGAAFAFRNITITTPPPPPPPPPPPDVATTITISAPQTVSINETFIISGILYETSSLLPIPNQTITIRYDSIILGIAITGEGGDYLLQASIPTIGNYTLTANF